MMRVIKYVVLLAGLTCAMRAGAVSVPLAADSKLQILSGRLGSRLLFSMNYAKKSAEIGALGFGSSSSPLIASRHSRLHPLEVKVEIDDKGRYLFPSRADSFDDLSVDLTMTRARISGKDKSGVEVGFSVFSPFAFAKTLDETEKIKLSSAPFFYLVFSAENKDRRPHDVDFNFSLASVQARPKPLAGLGALAWKDQGKRWLAGSKPDLALATLSDDGQFYRMGPKLYLEYKLTLQPGEKAERVAIFAGYDRAPVIHDTKKGTDFYFYYRRFFKSLDEVMAYAKNSYASAQKMSQETDGMLEAAKIPDQKKWLMALCFHAWLSDTWLVQNKKGAPRYYVWEGTYAFLSTVDVAHEVEVLSGLMPWALGLQLEEWGNFVRKTRYGDYLMHDMGWDQELGVSTYEWWPKRMLNRGQSDAMPVEENANYALLLWWYWKLTGDDKLTAKLLPTAEKLLRANIKRDLNGDGIADVDVMTTYDSSDALHKAPGNVYLGVKELSAYLVGAELCRKADRTESAEAFEKEAGKILAAIQKARAKYGFLPTALDEKYKGWDQASTVLGDGLLYPALTGFQHPIIDELVPVLRDDFRDALRKCAKPHGVVMTEGEGIIFFSKVMLQEPVARYYYQEPVELWDFVYRWNLDNPNAYNDGNEGVSQDWSGYNYPRGVDLFWELLPGPKNEK